MIENDNILTRSVLIEKSIRIVILNYDLLINESISPWWYSNFIGHEFCVRNCINEEELSGYYKLVVTIDWNFLEFYIVTEGEYKNALIAKNIVKKFDGFPERQHSYQNSVN